MFFKGAIRSTNLKRRNVETSEDVSFQSKPLTSDKIIQMHDVSTENMVHEHYTYYRHFSKAASISIVDTFRVNVNSYENPTLDRPFNARKIE